jgi:hypothetical protein
LTEPI